MVPLTEWPTCEIVETALRAATFLGCSYFLWDIRKRSIPPVVVRFRLAWTLVILAGVFDRVAFVSAKIYALALIDLVQLPGS